MDLVKASRVSTNSHSPSIVLTFAVSVFSSIFRATLFFENKKLVGRLRTEQRMLKNNFFITSNHR